MIKIFFIGFSLLGAYIYGGLAEWALHKYAIHGLGKNKKSWFNFHWHSHHKTCRKNNNHDDNYNSFLPSPILREITGLCLLAAVHVPIYFVMPYLFYTLIFCTVRYFYVHQKCHLNVEWGKVYFPWHYKHHMGKNQDANWGVTTAFWDAILGTREK